MPDGSGRGRRLECVLPPCRGVTIYAGWGRARAFVYAQANLFRFLLSGLKCGLDLSTRRMNIDRYLSGTVGIQVALAILKCRSSTAHCQAAQIAQIRATHTVSFKNRCWNESAGFNLSGTVICNSALAIQLTAKGSSEDTSGSALLC